MSIARIPGSLLKNLLCDCGRFLSQPPIHIRDGQTICSKCGDNSSSTPADITRNIPYEVLANLYAFPCQYRAYGCKQYIEFSKMKGHEAICEYCSFICPSNLHDTCDWIGAKFQLYEHYENEHPDLCLESPDIQITLNNNYEVHNLVKVEEILLLLQIKCSVQHNQLWFNSVCFESAANAAQISYNIQLKNANAAKSLMLIDKAHPQLVTNIQVVNAQSVSINISTVIDFLKNPKLVTCSWKIEVNDKLEAVATNSDVKK